MARIHPTAILEEGARLADDVAVGAYAYIGAEVVLGPRCRIHHHATVEGATVLGEDNEVFPYALIGGKTHDLKYRGGSTGLRIGNRNTFREYVTVHQATGDGDQTLLGDDNVILAYSHIAHDCRIGNRLIMSSHAALGGHVVVDDCVNIGWGAGVHQFCRLGCHAMVAAATKQVHDLLPFMISDGMPSAVRAINKVGLERAGYDPETIGLIGQVHRIVFRDGLNRSQALEKLRVMVEADPSGTVSVVVHFMESSTRGIA